MGSVEGRGRSELEASSPNGVFEPAARGSRGLSSDKTSSDAGRCGVAPSTVVSVVNES